MKWGKLHQAFSQAVAWVIFGVGSSHSNTEQRIDKLMGARGVLFTGLFLFATLACAPASEELDPDRVQALKLEVQQTLSDLTEAMNRHDPNEVLSYYRSGEEFLYLGCTDVLLGWQAFSVRAGNYYRANPDVVFQQEVIRIQVLSPSVAVAALRGSSSEVEALFWTQVLVKEDGAWGIAYEHESWPGCSPPPVPHPFTTPADTTTTPADTTDLVSSDPGGA
jgi:hypothetical protein